MFAALEVATGLVKAGHYRRRRRREFLRFMNDIVADYGADAELHVILDNLNSHEPKRDCWLARGAARGQLHPCAGLAGSG